MPAPPEGPCPALLQPVLLKRPFHVGERGQDALRLLGTDLGHLAGGGARRFGARPGILGFAAARFAGGWPFRRLRGTFGRGLLLIAGLLVRISGGLGVLAVLPRFLGALLPLPLLVLRLLILLFLVLLFLVL